MALTEPAAGGRRVTATGARVKITVVANIETGDLIGYATGWRPANASTGTATQGRLVALQRGANGDEIEATTDAIIDGFTGGTPGNPVYGQKGAGLGGEYTETAPAVAGDANTIEGYIIDSSTIQVRPGARPDSLAP